VSGHPAQSTIHRPTHTKERERSPWESESGKGGITDGYRAVQKLSAARRAGLTDVGPVANLVFTLWTDTWFLDAVRCENTSVVGRHERTAVLTFRHTSSVHVLPRLNCWWCGTNTHTPVRRQSTLDGTAVLPAPRLPDKAQIALSTVPSSSSSRTPANRSVKRPTVSSSWTPAARWNSPTASCFWRSVSNRSTASDVRASSA